MVRSHRHLAVVLRVRRTVSLRGKGRRGRGRREREEERGREGGEKEK